ncbi:hypothetical protein G7059_05650 [Erysipelothrix sp. HDW6A]|nr:hypothetical protein G7059_05650 [Erysipelothrix sp. HDW6A]
MDKIMRHMSDTETIIILESTINNCEKMIVKFDSGTSQHSLLKNRIKALLISKYVVTKDSLISDYTTQDIQSALVPLDSILHKTTKAIEKHEEGSRTYKRLIPMIMAISASKQALQDYLGENR